MKQIKRYVIWILLLSMLLLPGCKPETVDERELSVFDLQLSNEMKQDLLMARGRMVGNDWQYTWEDWDNLSQGDPRYGCRYYGTFDDCIVWLYSIDPAKYQDIISIEPYTSFFFEYFKIDCTAAATLLLYKDGTCYDLMEAYYNLGLISIDDVELVARRHYECEAAAQEYHAELEGLQ